MEAQIERHIRRIQQQIESNGGTILHTPLLCKNQHELGAKALRAVLELMKARSLLTETWTHEEHSYALTAQGGD